jgi:hypothetical protein
MLATRSTVFSARDGRVCWLGGQSFEFLLLLAFFNLIKATKKNGADTEMLKGPYRRNQQTRWQCATRSAPWGCTAALGGA